MKKTSREREHRASSRAAVARSASVHPAFAADDGVFSDALIDAYHQVMSRFRARPGVTGIDIGFQRRRGVETGKLAVRIHVREKMALRYLHRSEVFPQRLATVPVDVIQAFYMAQDAGDAAQRSSRFATIQPGISVSHFQTAAGTLGAIVTDTATSESCLVSAAHVLAPDDTTQSGDPIVQPSPNDGGRVLGDTVAELLRWDLDTDSAIARLTGSRPSIAAQFGSNVVLAGVRPPRMGEILRKSGRSSGVTRGRVEGAGEHDPVRFSFRLAAVDLDGPLPISEGGDSGAVWYGADGEAVGLHVARSTDSHPADVCAIACALTSVLDRLKASL